MKKFLSVLLALVMILSVTVVSFAASNVKGDFDGNGKVNSLDARYVLQVAAGLKTATSEEISRCDFDGNNKLTSLDARKVLQKAAGINENENSGSVDVGGSGQEGSIDWSDIVNAGK